MARPAAIDRKAFGKRLDRAIKASGRSRRQLSQTTGIDRNTINAWASGAGSPRLDLLERLAGEIDAGPDWLLFGITTSAGGATIATPADQELKKLRTSLKELAETIEALAKGADGST